MCNKQIVVMKKFFRMVMALSLVGGAFAFTGCTDYEDDINKLDDRLTTLEGTVKSLQDQIAAGGVITNVETTADGVTVTLSNGNSFTITNGTDGAEGKPGTVVTIEDGYCCFDGVKSEYPATGTPGKNAPTVYYVPGTEGDEAGFWVKVTEEEGKEPVRDVTEITWLPEGTVTAVWDTENNQLILSNVAGDEDGIVVIPLSTGMVTSVELVLSNSPATKMPELVFSTITEKENTFETGIENAIEFVKGAQKQRPGSFVVRVSPANAVLTPDMISLVNSKGENLDDFVTVTKVEKYNELLTRAATNSGLWKVYVALQNYNANTFAAKKYADPRDVNKGEILYAVQVNNTKDSDADRYVTSTYDITLAYQPFSPETTLWYFVDNSYVANINNRYSFTNTISGGKNPSLLNYTGSDRPAPEYMWDGEDDTPGVDCIEEGNNKNVLTDGAVDNRSNKPVFLAVQGEPITISLTTASDKITSPDNIRAMYVTLDKEQNAVESKPSEWNAWNNYDITGLNTVVEGTKTTITIDDESTISDFIGFRVYAVNYDGTLVDPDGKAFYVKVGDEAADWNAVATTIVPDAVEGIQPEEKSEDAVAPEMTPVTTAGGLKATWEDLSGATAAAPKFNAVFKAGASVVYSTASLNDFSKITDKVNFDDVTAIYTVPTVSAWTDLEDDKAYSGTLKISNNEGFVLATITVTMTKKLPTEAPGYTVKTSQLVNGVYNCYLVPDNWTYNAAKEGTMDMVNVFNWKGQPAQYVVSFAAAKVENNKDVANSVAGNGTLKVDKKYINNSTQHATTVSYNFGKISSKKNSKGEFEPTVLPVGDGFQTVFNCIYNDTYSWHWATIDEMAKHHDGSWADKDNKGNYENSAPSTTLTYGESYTMTNPDKVAFDFTQAIMGVSSIDSEYNAMLYQPYGYALNPSQPSLDLNNCKYEIITDANGEVNEYFKVEKVNGVLSFVPTKTETSSNPTADVPSTLRITLTDMYGHKDVVATLPMVVKKR